MGWYFRKSVSVGGLRFNLSQGGVGVSAGVPGLRFGVNARGQQYVHCGAGGIYYRKTLGQHRVPSQSHNRPTPTVTASNISKGPFQPVKSGNLSAMSYSSGAQLLAEIRLRHRRLRWHRWSAGSAIVVFALGYYNQLVPLCTLSLSLILILTPVLFFLDRKRKLVVRAYQLDSTFTDRYRQMTAAFKSMQSAKRVWLIDARAQVLNGKYHAGASQLVKRERTSPAFNLPKYFKSNVVPPMISVGRQTFYFFPDTILAFDSWSVGSIGYDQLTSSFAATPFIEDERPPRDAQQIGQTWKFVNKSGGPDRRFSNNRQLPIMQYGELRLQSSSGLAVNLQVSKLSAAQEVAGELRSMAFIPRVHSPQPHLSQRTNSFSVPPASQAKRPWPKI